MGHKSSNHSESPVRGQGSPHRKSSSRRQRSPLAPHRSSRRDGSPARGKHSSHALKRDLSSSPSLPARKKNLQRDESPQVREKNSSLRKSPRRGKSTSPSPPARPKSSQRDSSPLAREKNSSHAKSQGWEMSWSPSPRTKQLRKAQAEREVGKVTERDQEKNHIKVVERSSRKEREAAKMAEREHERNHGKGVDRGTRREREAEKLVEREHERNDRRSSDKIAIREIGMDREASGKRRERSSGGHDIDGKSSRAKHGRSASPSDQHHRSKHRSCSPEQAIDTRERGEVTNSRGAEQRNGDDDFLSKMKAVEEALDSKKQKPSFELSGKLASETNRVRGITLLFAEPPDARKPDIRWRLYVFKGGEVLNEPLYIHRQSCYLFGRERRVADIPTDHPSCSKQHAVIQFRQVEKEKPDGMLSKQPRICLAARKLCGLMGVTLHVHHILLSSAPGEQRTRMIFFGMLLKLVDIRTVVHFDIIGSTLLFFGSFCQIGFGILEISPQSVIKACFLFRVFWDEKVERNHSQLLQSVHSLSKR